MNKKGFTVVELMTTFVLVAVISTLLVKLVITLKEIYISGDMKTTLITKQSTMTDKIYKDLKEKDLTKIESCGENVTNCIKFVFAEGTKTLIIDKTEKTLKYDNYTIKLDRGGYFGDVTINKYNSDIGSILHYSVPIYNKILKGDYGINITYQINNNVEFDNDIVFDVKDTGVTVTLDPNGGTVSQTTKQVTVGETYGSLPTPTREGYTFKGWHGKNMFDISVWEKYNSGGTNGNGSTVTTANGVIKISNPNGKDVYTLSGLNTTGNTIPVSRRIFLVGVKSNNNYTLSFKTSGTNRINTYNTCYYNLSNKEYLVTGFSNLGNFDTPGSHFKIIRTSSDTEYMGLRFGSSPGTSGPYEISYSYIQLEEGTTATAYEPYYIQANTKVVQDKNHTLKAIWEKN